MPLCLRPVATDQFDLVSHIEVEPDQVLYSGTVAQAFKTQENGVDFHAIFYDDTAIGFFKIDLNFHQRYAFATLGDLGLRAFMIDRRHQGKGYATKAVAQLPTYLARQYKNQQAVLLTVNLQNPAAIRCYLAGGFKDTGELFLEGIAGPQHVMRIGFSS